MTGTHRCQHGNNVVTRYRRSQNRSPVDFQEAIPALWATSPSLSRDLRRDVVFAVTAVNRGSRLWTFTRNVFAPLSLAGSLDNIFRRLLQSPRKILGPYVKEGMTVLDFGCGPGFFTLDLAYMVGESGRVIAADLQEGMLEKVRSKIHGTEIEKRITLHKTEKNSIGLSDKVDCAVIFYVVHELPDQEAFFRELASV